jgi:hypothetical protein
MLLAALLAPVLYSLIMLTCLWIHCADANIEVAKPFLHVVERTFAAYPSNSEIKSKCMFLKVLLA